MKKGLGEFNIHKTFEGKNKKQRVTYLTILRKWLAEFGQERIITGQIVFTATKNKKL